MKARMWRHPTWVKETDPEVLKELLDKMLADSGFTVLGFIDHHFSPFGYTALWLLSESHLAIHTVPEQGKTDCELSSCNQDMFVRFIRLLEPYEI